MQNPGIPLLGSGCPLGSGGSPLRFAHSLWLGVSLVVAMAGGCAVVKPDAADGGGGGGSGGSQGAGSDGPLAAKDRGTPTMPVMCGNGERTADEACDDGNTMGGDGCSADCKTVETGWSCLAPGRPCTPVCGDSRVVGAETCDDGNMIAGDGCSDICVVEPTTARCGDRIVEGDEECDEGAADTAYGTGCTADCRFAGYCGDAIVNGPEECDFGPGQNNVVYGIPATCTPNCTRPHFCGDAILDANDGEQCDFGVNNGLPGGECSVDCKIYIR